MEQLDRTLASDAERDATAERLQVAFAEGRLADTEFDQRMRSALTARTRADLAGVTEDLPKTAPVVHVRGFTYKGTVEVMSHPPAR